MWPALLAVPLLAMTAAQIQNRSGDEGRVSGQVIDAQSQAPVAGARVTLMLLIEERFGTFGREPRQALTDANGNFMFESLGNGRYSLSVERNGFAQFPDVLGRRPPDRLEIVNGQGISGLKIVLERHAVIAGRIVDAAGEPVADAHVSALRRVSLPGMNDFVPFGKGGGTNDLGEFRIAGLAEGEYLVVVAPSSSDPFATVTGSGATAVATYYPGTSSRAEATVLKLTPGQTITGVQFSMVTGDAFAVSGVVVDAGGNPVPAAMVTMWPDVRAGVSSGPKMRSAERDGSFRFEGVTPGTYHLNASPSTDFGGVGFVSTVVEGQEVRTSPAMLQVTVADRDVNGLRVVTAR